MDPALQGYAASVVDTVGTKGREALAADVLAVDHLFSRSAALQDAMTDVAVPARARRLVLEELLEQRVGAPARRLCAYAAGRLRGQEVPEGISWLARQLSTGAPATEHPLAHRQARERVGGYAAALFEDLSVAQLEEVEDELFRFGRIVASTPELRSFLTDRDRPAEARRAVADNLLAGKAHAATRRLVGYCVTGGRARDVVGTLDWLAEQAALARGWRVARVRSGQELDEEERHELEQTLSRLAGAPVELQVTVDRALLAGVDVEIGDLKLDATVRGRLDRLREHVLAGGELGLRGPGFGRAASRSTTGRQDDREGPRS